MRYLGIDFGSKRVGIALSDEKGEFAIPFIVLKFSKTVADEIVDIAKENSVKSIVMGESKNYKGEPNKVMAESVTLKGKLEARGYKVEFEPEFMTSINAERFQGKTEHTDSSAAALILQSYLDKKQNQNT